MGNLSVAGGSLSTAYRAEADRIAIRRSNDDRRMLSPAEPPDPFAVVSNLAGRLGVDVPNYCPETRFARHQCCGWTVRANGAVVGEYRPSPEVDDPRTATSVLAAADGALDRRAGVTPWGSLNSHLEAPADQFTELGDRSEGY
jgi:hypothetical protein